MKNKIENILNDLDQQGWSVQKQFFPTELLRELSQTLLLFRQQGILNQAGVGRKEGFHIEQSIRSDEISWFDEENLNEAQKKYLSITKELQDEVNQRFYLGLFELEVHFALYSPNAFYKRHLDQHKNQDTRVLTLITYLNENWKDDDGGELQIYLKNGQTVSVSPRSGTVVCFFSAEFEHEVLPAKRERASLTGWFRKRR
ncbi:MAG: 2OG-Fe(II) oxygenase [Gammaproteobacteria bacterium]|nr:2OG-Fe(II) oxygenase [Gammaproteobacteria bacterium]MCW8986145.1 2OG-Fe(II) oxygenase [Gammaproteobacteria bacterium]MCW9030936.1 2OG-Fe(II) oxygenase [Gammaproteobacteria bacterium]